MITALDLNSCAETSPSYSLAYSLALFFPISSKKLPLVYISDYTYYSNKGHFPASYGTSGGKQ